MKQLRVYWSFALIICFSFFSQNAFAQEPQKEELQNEFNTKRTLKKISSQKKAQLSKEKKENQWNKNKRQPAKAKKSKSLYNSPNRIERAKADLEKKKSMGNISKTEISNEEKRIKRSENQIKKTKQKSTTGSKKLQPIKEN